MGNTTAVLCTQTWGAGWSYSSGGSAAPRVDVYKRQWYWPIRWLKILARLPINEDSWLGWGHTIANPDGSPFAENTRFNGIMLVNPGAFPQKASVCPLSGGDEVNFYQLLPLYQEEMDFKLSHSAGELLDLFPEEDLETVDVDRPSVCLLYTSFSPQSVTRRKS